MITTKSKISHIVQRYLVSVDNYPKVIQYLKERFGKEDMIIQIYLRNLVQIVLGNNRTSRNLTFHFCMKYLETKLRSLKSLGISVEKYATVIFPLVKFCLSCDVSKIWESSVKVRAN